MPGPVPQTSAEQRQRVLELVAGGVSYSAAAEEVFGDRRLRGRVERIVRRDRDARPKLPSLDELLAQLPDEAEPESEDEPGSWLERLVPLFGRMLRRRFEADLPVSGRDLVALANLELRLENQRQVKRLNDLTRRFA